MDSFFKLYKSYEPVDVSGWEINPIPAAGRFPKLELSDQGKRYIIKFAAYKQNGLEIPYHISEYISCRILKSLGYDVQDVALAIFRERPGCLIKTFDDSLITFNGLGPSTMSQENLIYDLDALSNLFNEGKYDSDFDIYLWDTFLCDAFINNLDRHPNNWGFFKSNGVYKQAPLFDCASSLYSVNAFSLNKMIDIEDYVNKYGNSAIYYKGERHTFKSIITNEKSEIFAARLNNFVSNIGRINFSSLNTVSRIWPLYSDYLDFVGAFLEKQVIWFESIV